MIVTKKEGQAVKFFYECIYNHANKNYTAKKERKLKD